MFNDRQEAGLFLADKIKKNLESEKIYFNDLKSKAVVLGIPRGGVVVASQVAKLLSCSLDVIVVKKIGAPANPELAIGAVGETKGSQYIDERLAADVEADKDYINTEIENLKLEIKRREQLFREGRVPLDLKDKIVIIIDDGAATGATVIAAVREVWNNKPKRVIVGLPVVSKDSLSKLEKEADEVIFLDTPWPFFAVSQFFKKFNQIEDREVVELLKQ